jgi:hypothetical protein
MPKVVLPDGTTRTFKYTVEGTKAAKEYAKQYGGRLAEFDYRTAFKRVKGIDANRKG